MAVPKQLVSLYDIASHLVINLKNVTMKKLMIVFCFLSLFTVCSAPNFSEDQKKDMIEMSLYNYCRGEYEKELTMFVEHLGYKESRNDWTIINTINCFGEWQFSHSTLKHLGYGHITPEAFKNDPNIFPRELQLEVLKILMSVNEMSLSQPVYKDVPVKYEDFIGMEINGIPITKAGLLAGMHLGGLGGIKLFLLSNGRVDKKDAYGTKVSDYIKEFSIYHLSRDYVKILDYTNDERYVLDDIEFMSSLGI